MDGENIENDTKAKVRTENILSVFGAKAPFSNLSRLVWTGIEAKGKSELVYLQLVVISD